MGDSPAERLRQAKRERLQAFVDGVSMYMDGEPNVTNRAGEDYFIEGHLAVAPDDDFASSIRYDNSRGVVYDATLRFSDALADDYSVSYLRQTFEELLWVADPPGDSWRSYPMGDVGTGPHVVTSGSAVAIEAEEMVDFLGRLTDVYYDEFGE